MLASLALCASADAQPLQLGPVSVHDDADHNALNHAPPVAAMPSTSLQDTPRTVNVVDAAPMKQQGTTTLDEALRNVPGITIAIGEGGTLAGGSSRSTALTPRTTSISTACATSTMTKCKCCAGHRA